MESHTLNTHIGTTIRQMREHRGVTQSELAAGVQKVVGSGWDRQVVWRIEKGKSAVSASDLVAVAWVLECTVSDLMSTTEPVSLGGEQTIRTDAVVAGEQAMPEVEAWARFEEAGDALADVRHAWERYAHLIDVVRRRVADTPALKRRIETFGTKAVRHAVREMEDAFGFRPPADFDAERAARANPSPAMLLAVDALGTHKVHESQWRRWTRRQERSAR